MWGFFKSVEWDKPEYSNTHWTSDIPNSLGVRLSWKVEECTDMYAQWMYRIILEEKDQEWGSGDWKDNSPFTPLPWKGARHIKRKRRWRRRSRKRQK